MIRSHMNLASYSTVQNIDLNSLPLSVLVGSKVASDLHEKAEQIIITFIYARQHTKFINAILYELPKLLTLYTPVLCERANISFAF